MRKHTKESLDQLTPQRALDILMEGNQRFVSSLSKDHDHLETINETRDGQFPFAVVLSCMDSRTSVELIFDQGLGDNWHAAAYSSRTRPQTRCQTFGQSSVPREVSKVAQRMT